MKMLLEQESVSENNQYSLLSCEGNSHDQSIRRVLQSEDIDVVLIGKLKVSTTFFIFIIILCKKSSFMYIHVPVCKNSLFLYVCK